MLEHDFMEWFEKMFPHLDTEIRYEELQDEWERETPL